MKKTKQLIIATTAAIAISGITAVAYAKHKDDNDSGKGQKKIQLIESASIDINQAMTIALADTPGKAFEVELEREKDKAVWEIELVSNDNEMYEFEIDAQSGDILEKELERH